MKMKTIAPEIIQGQFNKQDFDKEYAQGVSAASMFNARDLSGEVASLIKDAVLNSSDKEAAVVLHVKHASDFSFALNAIKNDLSTVPELCETNPDNLSKSVRENIALTVYSNDNCSNSKREVLIKVVTDFQKYQAQSTITNKV